MAAPPATPASSSKFMLSKRQPSQRLNTPSQTAGAPRQFTATPRFTVSSNPRAASSQAAHSSTPSIPQPRGSLARGRATQDVIDVESSTESSDADSHSVEESHDAEKTDDVITSFNSESARHEKHQAGRPAKRRRISISPISESSPPRPVQSDALPEPLDIDSDASLHSPGAKDEDRDFSDIDSSHESGDDDDSEVPLRLTSPHRFLFQTEAQPLVQPQSHTVFKPPPQFRQPSAAATFEPQYPLPDAFSPQRRGAKYVNGGLAGELRDWLVDIKGTSDAADSAIGMGVKVATSTATASEGSVAVEVARRGTGFWLAHGRNNEEDDTRVVLAGEGRLSGLAERRNHVVPGCTVMTFPPMWDIELENRKWKVACDWFVTAQRD